MSSAAGGADAANRADGPEKPLAHFRQNDAACSLVLPRHHEYRTWLAALPARIVAGKHTLNPRLLSVMTESLSVSVRSAFFDGFLERSPSARVITSSNLVDCSTGRSAGLAPLRILST